MHPSNELARGILQLSCVHLP